MGERGPTPKRSHQRRRRNKPEGGGDITTAEGAAKVEVPEADPAWHPVAVRWFESLADSGQSAFYEPSDWALAFVLAESISRELQPQPVVIGKGDDARVEMFAMPPKGASLAAWLKGMTALMVSEGDRRRMRIELSRPAAPEGEEAENVSELDEWRQRLRGDGTG